MCLLRAVLISAYIFTFKKKMQVGQNLRMFIIDSVSSLITPVLGGAGTHGMFSRDK